jgi:hypothetical protein
MTLPAGSSYTFTEPQPVTPLPSNTIRVTGPTFPGNNQVWYTLTNVGKNSFTISRITISWPLSDQQLQQVRVGGPTINNQHFNTSPSVISSNWQGNNSNRTIGPGQAVSLIFSFQAGQANSNAANYSLSVQ